MHDFRPMGDKGILIHFEQKISPDISKKIRWFISRLEEAKKGKFRPSACVRTEQMSGSGCRFIPVTANAAYEAVIEVVPAYATVCVVYNPLIMDYEAMKNALGALLNDFADSEILKASIFEIPVLYTHETGPDLDFVSSHSGLSVEEIIEIHTSCEYLIYMLGFAPGFPYLGGMDERIAAPRLKVPRRKIVPGSVGIAGSQTGMYPIESPGGWQLIGRTPVKLYDPLRNPPVYYDAGDYIKYRAIDSTEFEYIAELEKSGKYEVKSWPKY